MKTYLREIILKALEQFQLRDDEIPDFQIEQPKLPEHGDAAANISLRLASILNQSPRSIAQSIVEKLEFDSSKIADVEIAGPGFINFRYAVPYLFDMLQAMITEGSDYGKNKIYDGKRIQVEFVSANPTGPLTVGHGRNAVLGDTIARLLEWCGATVEREYYFNNAGRQMRLLGESVKARYLQQIGIDAEFPDNGYEGEYIQDIGADLIREKGDSLSNTDGFSPFKEKAERMIFQDIQNTLERLHIKMDSFFNEHSLYDNGAIEETVDRLRSRKLAYDKEGAVWFKTTEFGKEKDTVLIKSSGEPTYRLPDIAYHANKLDRGFDLCIDILGADHIDTYPDVLSGLKSLGYDPSKIEVVVYQFVTIVKEGKPFKMSTRKANFVTLDELMDEVGSDVTRFFFLMRSPNTHLEFDIAEAKEESEKNPVFYLQYAHARIQSILRKAADEYSVTEPANLQLLTHSTESVLIKTMIRFPEAIQSATENREPHRLINYLHELAGNFTSFYHDCRILGEEENLVLARIALAKAVARVLANGLVILGIDAPDRM